jgi:hypothetical protein
MVCTDYTACIVLHFLENRFTKLVLQRAVLWACLIFLVVCAVAAVVVYRRGKQPGNAFARNNSWCATLEHVLQI